MTYRVENDFEDALVRLLTTSYGWSPEVLHRPTEQDLIDNWASILFNNNRQRERLNGCPLTEGEMQQVLEQIQRLKTPYALSGFINGGDILIKRDNEQDREHFGKEVSLKLYNRREIAAGESRYQIARQPQFKTSNPLASSRRGDLMLLINGMPVFHIELKRSSVPVSQACHQLERYAAEGVYSGIFALVQIMVAMTPEETLYFANPGPGGKFNPNYFFHWADFNNEPINDWKRIAERLLSIPMAHQLIGFYSVADGADGILKVLRSYQYYAASSIADKVHQTHWDGSERLGGYVWHTTGSGKTLTSFKSAQLISASGEADKVVFLVDRIELGTQSLNEYRNFATEAEDVQATENTHILVEKLKSADPANRLIVTSIQKMDELRRDAESGMKDAVVSKLQAKKVVFIVDECHRSTFGDALAGIKLLFNRALFFGFTGTPIHEENSRKGSTTTTIFGNELHRYSLADGIRDKNVLGFDTYMVQTYKEQEVRRQVALYKAKAKSEEEAWSDDAKSEVYQEWLDKPMADIEKELPNEQYNCDAHHEAVMQNIRENWMTLSRGGKFHAILATSGIPEAMAYYRLFKAKAPELRVTALFDPSIDNDGSGIPKEEWLSELVQDYNERYGMTFDIASFPLMKKDIAARLAHKKPYERVEHDRSKQLDLLIVVNQMLTGYDSKWVNTLYLDKVLEFANLIQAFSRTNRLFGPDKPFGTIKYYRRPFLMKRNIEEAVKLYSGDKPLGLFVDKLGDHLRHLNEIFADIKRLFERNGVKDFLKLPEDVEAKAEFALLYRRFREELEAATIQGFDWKQSDYIVVEDEEKTTIHITFDEASCEALLLRYKELLEEHKREPGGGGGESPYDLSTYLTDVGAGLIDHSYMNSRFQKWLKAFQEGKAADMLAQAEEELHRTFQSLTQEEQKYANIFLHDIQRGDVVPEDGKSLSDYIAEYRARAENDRVQRLAAIFGLNAQYLRAIMESHVTEENLNEYARFDKLMATLDKQKAKDYFEKMTGVTIAMRHVNAKAHALVRKFILEGGFDIE